MCYDDGPGTSVRVVCDDWRNDDLFDCNHDDYFSARPPRDSYLATHWNTARGVFLSTAAGTPPPPQS